MSHDSALADLEAYSAAAREIERLLAGDPDLLQRAVPAISGWAPVQHAAHVTLANELVLRNLVNLAKGSGLLVLFEAEPKPAALAVLASGALPRGVAKAPRMVTPPLDIDVRVAREWASKLTADLDALRASIDVASAPRCFIPHQELGPLDLGQWIRFGLVHSRHHLAIAREVMAVSS
ncbi:MAG: DinB family protein [Planctomycetes bacterium]|nr:DinB family protein [Planctomycetota bacterium]